MDNPTWTDTFRASLASCVQIPCLLPFSSSSNSESYTENETRRVANPRAAAYARTGTVEEEEEAADAISLHSQFGSARNHVRRRPPPRRIGAFFGLHLFGAGRGSRIELPEDVVDPLHRVVPSGDPNSGVGGCPNSRHTSALNAGAPPENEVAGAEADAAKRARRRMRKELRRQREVAALAQSPLEVHGEFDGVPGGTHDLSHLPLPHSSSHASLPKHEQEDDDADVDLDGGVYARLAPRGGTAAGGSHSSGRSRSSGEESRSGYSGFIPPPMKSTKRTGGSRSSATSSTLASPPPSVTSFRLPLAGKMQLFEDEEEFDGTPGGLGLDSFPVMLGDRVKIAVANAEPEEEFDGTQGF
ncbi:hypothetical protein C8R43DRAFT_1045272 [Mycena crocata]|nr:hypothetical protein C8R43DRAFT_1045272 [Mycena crocata]